MLRIRMIVTLGAMATLASSLMAAGDAPAPGAPPSPFPGRAVGPVYVVDQNHPKASDANPGTSEAPWKTIGKAAATAKAGDAVCVMEGVYPEQITFAHSGLVGKPIVFKGVPRHKATVSGRTTKDFSPGFVTTGCNYLRIEGFEMNDMDTGVLVDSDHVEVVDNRFNHVEAIPVDVKSAMKSDSPAYVYVAFNRMYQCCKGVLSGGSHWLFERNEVTRLGQYNKGDSDYSRPFGCNQVFRHNHFHGTFKKEIGGAHVDGFQLFDRNGEVAHDILMEENVCSEYAEGLMAGADREGCLKNLVFRRNIFFQRGTDAGWANHQLCFGGTIQGLVADGNTFIGGCSGDAHAASNVRFDNNILYRSAYWLDPAKVKNPSSQRNLIYRPGETNFPQSVSNLNTDFSRDVYNVDPLFEGVAKDNVRLKKGSPAIGAGVGGVTIGALDYPNVYYVDPWHGGASDEGFGYPGAPYRTIAKAISVAEDGETIVLRGAVYRGLVKPTKAGVALRAAKGEKVTISGADEISGWKRQGDAWAAPLAAKPTRFLRDGEPFTAFTYDDAAKTVAVSGFDPRLSLMETVVRDNAIDLSSAPATKIAGLDTADTLGEAVVGQAKQHGSR